MGVIKNIHQDSNHTGNPVVLFEPLTSDQTICVGVFQTIHQDSYHIPNPAGVIQTITICLSQTIPTKILYHGVPLGRKKVSSVSIYIAS